MSKEFSFHILLWNAKWNEEKQETAPFIIGPGFMVGRTAWNNIRILFGQQIYVIIYR